MGLVVRCSRGPQSLGIMAERCRNPLLASPGIVSLQGVAWATELQRKLAVFYLARASSLLDLSLITSYV